MVDGVEQSDEQDYAFVFPGAIILESSTEEIEFAVKHPVSKEVMVSQLFHLEQNKFYNAIVCGSAEEPVLLFHEIETTPPSTGNVKIQALHSIPNQGPIDLYMGDTTQVKRVLTALEFIELSDPFEVSDLDIRAEITLAAHSEHYHSDSVLLSSKYNDIVSGGNYFSVLSHFTYDTTSELTFWLYALPLQY